MNSNERWTQEEKLILQRMWKAGIKNLTIAVELGRSISGVKNQRMALGLEKRRQDDKKQNLSVNVDAQTYRKVCSMAHSKSQTVSEYIRNLIRRDLGG